MVLPALTSPEAAHILAKNEDQTHIIKDRTWPHLQITAFAGRSIYGYSS
jgi:hypothetical protein